MNRLTRIFLVVLRLAIGWQILVEGVDKLGTLESIGWFDMGSLSLHFGPPKDKAPWSSEAYLREGTGPLSPFFRKHVLGDPDESLLQHLKVEDNHLPPALEEEWDFYLKRFTEYYALDDQQRQRAEAILAQHKQKAVRWLKGDEKALVKRTFPNGTVEAEQTMPQRLAEFEAKLRENREVQAAPWETPAAAARDKIASTQSDLRRMRTELQGEVSKWTDALKKRLAGEPQPDDEKKTASADAKAAEKKRDTPADLLTPEQKALGPVPEPLQPRQGDYLDWAANTWLGFRNEHGVRPAVLFSVRHIDQVTMWGLTIAGLLLLLGLFSRTSSLAGAIFLLLFYLEMTPLPWLPPSPMSEGHYLIVNKTLIEALALLVLATVPTGRWFGLDGLVRFLWPWHWLRRAPAWDGARARARDGEVVTVSRAGRSVTH